MKNYLLLCVLAPLIVFALTGCQQSAVESIPLKGASMTVWEENCSVEQASAATKRALEDLGLRGSGAPKTRSVTTRDPKTGRTITKQVPINTGTGSISLKSDGLSVIVKTKSVAGIEYDINIILLPPKSCRISMAATSPNQPQNILDLHSRFIKQKIGEAIQQKPDAPEPVPYPETMIFDRTVREVSEAIYSWHKEMGLDGSGAGEEDQFYKETICNTASRIRFTFKMRLIDTNKTKLEIDVQGYEGKEEFKMILKSLEDVLKGLEENKIITEDTTQAVG